MNVSVILPALNEAAHVGAALRSAWSAGAHECIVADGGSEDATVSIARDGGAWVVETERGRARQMNAGARQASGKVLLFLHADTRLPNTAMHAIARTLRHPEVHAGIFRLRFTPTTPLLSLYAKTTALPWGRIAFGDRALFVRKDTFETLGGFADVPIFEDLDLVSRLQDYGKFAFLKEAVETSPRRFTKNGPVAQQWRNFTLWARYYLGASPEALAHRYGYGPERGE